MFNLQQGRRAELHALWVVAFGGGPVVAATCAYNTTYLQSLPVGHRIASWRTLWRPRRRRTSQTEWETQRGFWTKGCSRPKNATQSGKVSTEKNMPLTGASERVAASRARVVQLFPLHSNSSSHNKSFTRGWPNPSMLPRVFGRFSKRYGCDTSFEPCSWNPCKLMSRWMDALTMMFENPCKTDKPVPMDWTQHAHMNREGNIWFSWENIHTPRGMVYTTLQKKEPR